MLAEHMYKPDEAVIRNFEDNQISVEALTVAPLGSTLKYPVMKRIVVKGSH